MPESISGLHKITDLSIQLLHSETKEENSTFVYAAIKRWARAWRDRRGEKATSISANWLFLVIVHDTASLCERGDNSLWLLYEKCWRQNEVGSKIKLIWLQTGLVFASITRWRCSDLLVEKCWVCCYLAEAVCFMMPWGPTVFSLQCSHSSQRNLAHLPSIKKIAAITSIHLWRKIKF